MANAAYVVNYRRNMWQKLSSKRLLIAAISWVSVVAAFSVPILLPRFSGRRLPWLIFTFVLAAVSTAVAVLFTWIGHKFVARSSAQPANVARTIASLLLCSLLLVVLSHHAAEISDTLFFVLALPYLAVAWLIFHQWRTLFAVMTQKWHWSHRTRIGTSLLIFVLSLSLLSLVGPHNGILAGLICLPAVVACGSVRVPET